jgi:hypothetical protein
MIKNSSDGNYSNPGGKAAPVFSFVLLKLSESALKKFEKDGMMQILKILFAERCLFGLQRVLNTFVHQA